MRFDNRENSRRVVKNTFDIISKDIDKISAALRKFGEESATRSKTTKNYTDRTGDLKRSHFSELIMPGENKSIEFSGFWRGSGDYSRTAGDSINIKADENEILLLIGARKFYGAFVERKYGFDVVIQEFVRWRTEIPKIVKGAL